MKKKPIIFNTEMVRAILDGRKTQTRRTIKDADITNSFDIDVDGSVCAYCCPETGDSFEPWEIAPWRKGDILWVRETWSFISCEQCKKELAHSDFSPGCNIPTTKRNCLYGEYGCYIYRANYGSTEDDSFPPSLFRWRPSIHMPKAAARIWLRATDVRAERLQDITLCDVWKEGTPVKPGRNVTTANHDDFIYLWNNINGKRGYEWEKNPWVWVIEFERMVKREVKQCKY